MIRFRLFGALELLRTDGSELRSVLAQPKRLALLAYLAASAEKAFRTRATLAALFWPELSESRARASLSQALYYLRQELGTEVFASRGAEEVRVDDRYLWSDIAEFRRSLRSDDGRALELYKGDILAGHHLVDSAEWERWLEDERADLRRQAVEAAWRLAEEEEKRGHEAEAVQWATRALNLSQDDELAFRRLILLLDRLGDGAGALRAYEEYSSRLARDFDLEVSSETRELIAQIRSSREAEPHQEPLEGVSRAEGPSPGPFEPSTESSRAVSNRGRYLLALAGVVVTLLALPLLLSFREDQSMSAAEEVGRPEAHQLYLRGRHLLSRGDAESFESARQLFEESLELDPTYAEAWSGLSDSLLRLSWIRAIPASAAYPRARAAAERALELDPDLAEAHASLAKASTHYFWDSEGAKRHFDRAIELDPTNAETLRLYSAHLRNQGRFAEARTYAERAVEIDPMAFFPNFELIILDFMEERHEEAIEKGKDLVSVSPDYPMAHFILARSYVETEQYELALDELDAMDARGGPLSAMTLRAYIYGVTDRRKEALELLDRVSDDPRATAYDHAVVHLGLGEKEKALELIEKSIEDRDPRVRLLKAEPIFDSLHSEERFQVCLKRAGLT